MKLGFETTSRIYNAMTHSWDKPLPPLDSERTLVTCFGSGDVTKLRESLEMVRKTYPNSLVIGCSTAGEIHESNVLDDSLTVGIAKFVQTNLRQVVVKKTSSADSYEVGSQLAKQLQDPELKAIFILSEGINVNGTELVRGVNSVVDEHVVVTGGLAGDGPRFERTWVLAGAQIGELVTAIGFYGDHVVVSHGSKGGWDNFGPVRTVTKSSSNVLYELDGQPALQVYEKYLGPRAKDLPSSGLLFPLAIQPVGEDKVLVRTLLSIDREMQSLTFAGDIPVGSTAQLMKAHLDRLIDGAEQAAQAIALPSKNQEALTIAISCVGRRLILADRTEEELEVLVDTLDMPKNVLVGFYSYGELSPVGDGCCDLHNQTMTLTSIGEHPPSKLWLKQKLSRSLSAIAPAKPPVLSMSNVSAPNKPEEVDTQNHSLVYDLSSNTWSAPLPPLDSDKTLVLVFGSPAAHKAPNVIDSIYDAYPSSHILGCSGAGEIVNDVVHDDKVTVVVKPFVHTRLESAYLPVNDASDSYEVGSQLAKQLQDPELKAIFILSEGINVNGTELVRGVNSVVDEHVVVTGGLAGDGPRFEHTWVLANRAMASNMVSAVGFYGDHVVVSHGSRGGWDNFGPVRTVTRSSGNVLYELDGKPALALYKTYLGDKAKDLPSSGLLFPISLIDTDSGARNVVRTLLSVDHEAQSLTFAGDMPQGAKVQLMKARFDRLIDGAQDAAKIAMQHQHEGNPLAIAVSCVGRRLVLGTQTEDELDVVLDVLPKSTTMAGFYSYGELSPVGDGCCDLHNQTMTLTLFDESLEPVVNASKRKQNTPNSRGDSNQTLSPTTPPIPSPQAQPPSVPKKPNPKDTLKMPQKTLSVKRAESTSAPVNRLTIPVQGAHTNEDKLLVDIQDEYGVKVVRLIGKMDEKFQGAQLGRKLEGLVIIDLAEVYRITSFGVREWLAMLKASNNADEIYLVRCSEAIANQLATIRAFKGGSHVTSFFAPYRCEHCEMSFNALLDVEHDRQQLSSNVPPAVSCLRCHKETTGLDEDAEYFFSFVSSDVQVPDFVRDVISQLPPMRTIEPVEKLIKEDNTVIKINAALDKAIRWRRLILDVEGEVVIDLQNIEGVTSDGAKLLVQHMKHSIDDASFVLLSPPYEVLQMLYAERVLATCDRIQLDGEGHDGQRTRFYTSTDKVAEVLHDQPMVIEANGRRFDVSHCRDMLCFLLGVSAKQEPVLDLPEASAQPPTTQPTKSLPLAQEHPNNQANIYLKAIPLILLVVILASVVVWKLTSNSGRLSSSNEAAVNPPTKVSSVPSKAQSNEALWSTGKRLRPSWADTAFAQEEQRVLLTGKGVGKNEDAALSDAMKQAHLVLIKQLQGRLKGEAVYQVIQSQASVSAAQQVKTLLQQQQGALSLKRVDYAFKRVDGQVVLFAQYTIPKKTFDALIHQYAQRVDTPTMSFGVRFPTIAGPDDHDVIVVKSQDAKVRLGDVILSESQESVYTLKQLRERVAKRDTLKFVCSSKGVAKTFETTSK